MGLSVIIHPNLCLCSRDVKIKATCSNFGVSRCSFVVLWKFAVCPSDPKLVYMNSESDLRFEVMIRLPGIYRMSEDGVYT